MRLGLFAIMILLWKYFMWKREGWQNQRIHSKGKENVWHGNKNLPLDCIYYIYIYLNPFISYTKSWPKFLVRAFQRLLNFFFFLFFALVALKSSSSTRPERNGIQETSRTGKCGEGMQILEGELLLQVCFAIHILYKDLNLKKLKHLYLAY